MNIEFVRGFLLWCTAINYAVLLAWFLVFVLARDWIQRLHGRWFHLTSSQFDVAHYTGMALYKIGILLLNLVPYVALHVLG